MSQDAHGLEALEIFNTAFVDKQRRDSELFR